MTFADLVEEVRQLPSESMTELQRIIRSERRERYRQELLEGHAEAMELLEAGKLPPPTSDVNELIRRLNADD